MLCLKREVLLVVSLRSHSLNLPVNPCDHEVTCGAPCDAEAVPEHIIFHTTQPFHILQPDHASNLGTISYSACTYPPLLSLARLRDTYGWPTSNFRAVNSRVAWSFVILCISNPPRGGTESRAPSGIPTGDLFRIISYQFVYPLK